MSGDGNIRKQYWIILYLIASVVVLIAIGAGVRYFLNQTWLAVVEIAVTGVLSVALVLLYFRQTRILESQKNLLTQELNREARQKHTETLRERVRLWHGNPDKEIGEDFIEGPDLNIPRVNIASFESAPTGAFKVAFEEEEEFQVIPYQLKGDRYLEDLLQNHAPDLRETVEKIFQLHERFAALREEFSQEYDGRVVEKTKYTLKPTDYFARWIFEFLVTRERGYWEDQVDLVDRALSELERGQTNFHEAVSPRILVHVNVGGGSSRAIYEAILATGEHKDLRENQDNVKEDVTEILKKLRDEIDDEHLYKLAHDAAETLDEAERAVNELEQSLIEYDGRPIYTGDCKYLQEARLS